MNKCDVIIPIYNAYDCVVDCIESVLKNTKFNGNKLILINDCSTDSNITPMLEKYASKNKNIVFLSNEKNLGFVGTVNKGMQYSKNDCLLLNSDTEVTANWLDKLTKCAYSSENIATVTPLSNNATLASVPNFGIPNDIPEGLTLEEMGKIVEECSFNDYPEIPTGHGFCLYIKRSVLDKVGFFDEKSYGKGYGEENDFCFRCFEYGYQHVLCDNTYILHKESKSFLSSKKALIEQGLRVLDKKYPVYRKNLDKWLENRPIEYICKNIAFHVGNRKEKTNILYIIHDWSLKKIGGTTLHAIDLINNLKKYYNFHILTFEDGVYKIYSYYENSNYGIALKKVPSKIKILNFYNNDYKRLVEEVIDDYKINFVHIHHLIHHYFDVVDVLLKKNIKYMVTLHDFYSTCPLINKLYKNETYCGNPCEEKCNECLNYVFNQKLEIKSWRNEWQKVLENAEYVITPSNATKLEFLQNYPNIKFKTIEHGVDIIKSESNLTLSKKNDIAFLGAIGFHKGSKILEKFIKSKKLKNTKIHLFGYFDSLKQGSTKNFINHGKYKRDELKELLIENNIKLVCLFSIWPETYSYIMTEAIACGIPVIAFDFGAIAERIKKYNLGWVVTPTDDINLILNKINDFLSDKENYDKVISSINSYKVKTTKEMAKEYKEIYDLYSKEKNLISLNVKYKIKNDYVTIEESDYSWVFHTLKWRLISKIKLPKPVKKICKNIKNKITK